MTECRFLAPAAVALLLAGASPAPAYDESLPGQREPPCSALCRSWMGWGRGEPDRAAEPAPAAAVPPRGAPPAVKPRPRAAAPRADRRAASVPLPPPRPAARIADPGPAAAELAAPLPLAAPEVAAPPPPLAAPEVAAAAPPAPAAPVESAAAGPVPPNPPPLSRAAALPRGEPPARGTPLAFKLGIYAALAAVVGWPLRPRLRKGRAGTARAATVHAGPRKPSITRA